MMVNFMIIIIYTIVMGVSNYGSPKMDGLSWFIMDIIKIDDLGYPIFRKPPCVIARLDHQILFTGHGQAL